MVSQGLAELRLRNSSNLVMADTFTEVHRKDGLVCAVGDAAAVSVECAGVDGLEGWLTKWWNVYDADKRSASMKGTESDLEYWVTPETAAAIRKHTDEVWWKEDQSAAFFKKMDKELGKMK